MPDVMMPTAPTERHPDFEHVAVYHAGGDDLAEQLAPDIARALEAGDAVLLCSAPDVWSRIAAKLGQVGDGVEYISDEIRYEHPNVAMRILHDFARERTRDSGRAAWSIGAIPFDGEAIRNAEWLRYEAAVTQVLSHLPLRAVCTYDTTTTPPELLEHARCTHSWAEPDGIAVIPPVVPPDHEPMLRLVVHSSRSARQTVAAAYHGLVDDDACADLTLVVSEIVSNALTHGAPPVTMSAWFDEPAATSTIDVTDNGRGIDDPFVDLRPPRPRPGGAGMWIVGQLSERVTSHRVDGVHHVTARIRHR
jgi:anti-sigma regulatory factor (Ser/Thr protein kinase)